MGKESLRLEMFAMCEKIGSYIEEQNMIRSTEASKDDSNIGIIVESGKEAEKWSIVKQTIISLATTV